MKVIHIADLHLGKLFHKLNIIKDQEYVLTQILDIMEREKANLIIAGDIFDSANPSLEAQELFLKTMRRVADICRQHNKKCWIIVGNHDSNRRLLLWRDFLLPEIQIVDEYLLDEWEGVRFAFLSFIKPVFAQMHFNQYFDSYQEAFRAYIKNIPEQDKTVLVTHQTFDGCTTGSSETMSLFDDAVSVRDVRDFPLVLAGHIHKRQRIQNVSYSGSLLPYAFGDKYTHDVEIWDIDLTEGNYQIESYRERIKCLHDLKIVKGDLKRCLAEADTGDYTKVEVIEEGMDLDLVMAQLKEHFSNLVTVSAGVKDTWEANLNKPAAQFKTFDEALNAFCEQIEIPEFTPEQMKLIQEVVYEITEAAH